MRAVRETLTAILAVLLIIPVTVVSAVTWAKYKPAPEDTSLGDQLYPWNWAA